jgi:hypothetical protein
MVEAVVKSAELAYLFYQDATCRMRNKYDTSRLCPCGVSKSPQIREQILRVRKDIIL